MEAKGYEVEIISYSDPRLQFKMHQYRNDHIIGHSMGSVPVKGFNMMPTNMLTGRKGLDIGLFGRHSNDILVKNHSIDFYTEDIDDYLGG